jgi:hypothetical protein
VSRALQDYYREGEGSLMQCVLTPADAYMPLTNEAIAAKVDKQVGIWGVDTAANPGMPTYSDADLVSGACAVQPSRCFPLFFTQTWWHNVSLKRCCCCRRSASCSRPRGAWR